jgi:outer membrane protein insertion porin family
MAWPSSRRLVTSLLLGALLGAHATARAQPVADAQPVDGVAAAQDASAGEDGAELPEEDEALAQLSRQAALDASFGPLLSIERIEITGNTSTSRRLILQALPIAVGDALRAGDPRFRRARFKLLSTGYFRAVELDLRKGTRPGHVILTVHVTERGTVILNSLHFGTSSITPWWAGMDLSERNFFGTGVGIGFGGMVTGRSDVDGGQQQHAFELRVDDPSLFPALVGKRLGAHVRALRVRAAEPVRVRAAPDTATPEDFCTLPYTRTGGRAGVGTEISPLAHLAVDVRVERIDTELPAVAGLPACSLADGTPGPADVDLAPGRSWLVSTIIGFDRDRRPDPILPDRGDRLLLLAEVGRHGPGAENEFVLLLARYGRWWPIRAQQHALSLHLTGGLIVGQAPRFDRLHAVDFNRLLTPRAYGLIVSTTPPLDALDTGADQLSYGDVGGSAVIEYSYRLFRSRRYVYGGNLFVGAGIWGLAERHPAPERRTGAAFPVDLLLDAGLRVDTEIGIFELSFANALGRIPL